MKFSGEIMKENIMLSSSTSNSSFLNGNYADMDDRMTILDYETREAFHRPMSKIRKIAFFASVASIVLVIIVFLLLPCHTNCVSKHQISKFKKTMNWMTNYEKIEFKGNINTLRSNTDDIPLYLILMYRNDKILFNGDVKKPKQKFNGGIIKIFGNSGEISWKNEMTNEPRSIDCNLIDCNKKGKNDCLIIDDYGQLACVDENGHWIYYNSNSKTSKIEREVHDFPLIVPDFTKDDVHEIVMGSYKGNSAYLTLISGSNGKILAEEIQNCSYIDNLQLDSESMVKFICISKNNTEQQIFKNLTSLYSLISKRPTVKKLSNLIKQHNYSNKFTSLNTQTTTVSVLNKEIKIENKGMWPRECKTTIKLTSNENGIKKTRYSFTGSKTYVFTPVKFSVNITTVNKYQNENIHGFIVKYWTWNGTEVTYNFQKPKSKREVDKIGKSIKVQRNNYTNQTSSPDFYKTKLRFVTETINMIVFNSTHMMTENTSQSNIMQFCQNTLELKGSEGNLICQPDLKNQENSLAIVDIDNDGSKELISYYSTFFNENQDDKSLNSLKLKSFIQLFKLETELPKLYRSDFDIF